MKLVRLGRTDLKVSRVGIGGIPIQRPSLSEAVRIVNHALDLGVNFIDTANGYGDSEERIGKAIAGRRENVVVATKTAAPDRETALEHLKLSLKRLNTDYIDLWQFHNLSTLEKYERVLGPSGAMDAAQEALRSGRIRHLGFSSHNIDVARKAIESGLFETIQYPFNFVTREAADQLVPLAKQHDLGFIAMKPFAGGNIRDARLAIKYLLQFDNVVPDPGIEKREEIEEIVGIVNGPWKLTAQDWQTMDEIRSQLGNRYCRQCQYCMPCPQGVNIWMLLYVRNLWRLWPPERFFPWIGPIVETAKNCVQCGACETKCPFHLPIREMLVENVEFYWSLAKQKT